MTIQILSLVIALLAVIVGPIITYHITKKNLEFQFISMTQEGWIAKLYDASLEFLTNSHSMFEKYPTLMERFKVDDSLKNETNIIIDEMIDSINLSMVKFQLLLKDDEPIQQEIISETLKMKKILLKQQMTQENVTSLSVSHEKIIKNLKEIMHTERSKISNIFK